MHLKLDDDTGFVFTRQEEEAWEEERRKEMEDMEAEVEDLI